MTAKDDGGHDGAEGRSSAWRAQLRRALPSLRRPTADELRPLGVVVAVVLIRFVHQTSVEFAIDRGRPDFNLVEQAASMWEDLSTLVLIALAMFVVIQPLRRRAPAGGARRVAAIVAAIGLAIVVAVAIQTLLMISAGFEQDALSMVGPGVVAYGLPAAFLVTLGEFHRREVQSVDAMRAAEADRTQLEQQTLQARVKTLEAQIEPHFLFNTLANVRRLYEVDPAAGDAMLDRMMRYLEVALPSMRGERVTLGREADLIEAYLDLQKVRMGRRLAFQLDIAPALRPIEVPPMMLLTLVENAIKHGLAPQRGGGRVDIGARLDGAALELEVADTGAGFGSDVSGGGTGLANIQARLAAMFGNAAQLTLGARQPHGVRATIRIPAVPTR
jgi:sensor histidine kinase YesM